MKAYCLDFSNYIFNQITLLPPGFDKCFVNQKFYACKVGENGVQTSRLQTNNHACLFITSLVQRKLIKAF